MFAQSFIFLRFGCYVHNPDAVFARNAPATIAWLDSIKEEDPEWGYRQVSGGNFGMSVLGIDVPSTLHQVLHDFDADYTFTEIPAPMARAILAAKRNSFRLTTKNIRLFARATRTTPGQLVDVLESYLTRIEVNPVQPVTREEIKAIKDIGVSWDLAARLPRMDEGGFEPIYIVDEHHRTKCL